MRPSELFDFQWPYLLTFLPQHLDLERSAKVSGALIRRRQITSADDLLRLALVYGFCGYSLRQTAAWAETAGIASLSDVAVLKRLRKAAPWLGQLLGAKLAQRMQARLGPDCNLRARLIDATTVSKPGSRGTDWRIHLGLDLATLTMDSVEATTSSGGESFARSSKRVGEILVADRAYGHRRGLHSVRDAGAHFLVRISWQNLPLQRTGGEPIEVFEELRRLPDATVLDMPVLVAADKKLETRPLPARWIVIRKSEAAAQQERQRILSSRSKKQKTGDPRTLEAAAYTLLLTSVPEEILSAREILELYRFRWQIELAFKRLKSLLNLDGLKDFEFTFPRQLSGGMQATTRALAARRGCTAPRRRIVLRPATAGRGTCERARGACRPPVNLLGPCPGPFRSHPLRDTVTRSRFRRHVGRTGSAG